MALSFLQTAVHAGFIEIGRDVSPHVPGFKVLLLGFSSLGTQELLRLLKTIGISRNTLFISELDIFANHLADFFIDLR